jgi:hypothetical protein
MLLDDGRATLKDGAGTETGSSTDCNFVRIAGKR